MFSKNKIFDGESLIIKNSTEVIEIIKIIHEYFYNIFDYKFQSHKNQKLEYNQENLILFTILQNRVKKCKFIRQHFVKFLCNIGLDIKSTYMDLITLRFSPRIGKNKIGNLSPTKAHRDTWASNLFNQINFWFPIHNVTRMNSIFIVPYYFNHEVENNSVNWNFKLHKRKDKYPSTPVSNVNFNKKDKISFKLSKGDVLCFSGHHLHGSIQSEVDRLNLETRVVCSGDFNRFKIPKNLDSKSKIKKKKWFRNLKTGKHYP